jgi:L-alanine-DL-glutamate epimerase-like enolase superfamily enzyme
MVLLHINSNPWSRRRFVKMALALPLAGLFSRLRAFAAPHTNRVKITDIKVMQIQKIAGNSLIKIETDSGLVGYGEAGVSGPMGRARIEAPIPLPGGVEGIGRMRDLLIGKDPLAIEVHFQNMTSLMHYYMANIPTVSGIDIALWDLAGKITGLPVYSLLGGPFRDSIRMYSHGDGVNMIDKGSCRAFADRVKAMPEGFNAFKFGGLGVPSARFAPTLDQSQIRYIAQGYSNIREALPDNIEIACHCHDEFDEPSAVAVAKAVEPVNPIFIEDLLFPTFSQAWMSVRRQVRVPLLTGEKLELLDGFKPFIDNEAVDIIHPDLSFAGGFTGVKKIAAYAYLARMPVALHNVGSLILTCANAHFGASIQNFYRSESQLGEHGNYIYGMAATPLEVRDSHLKVPTGPGLGLDINPDFLKQNLSEGEVYWG